jgi:hypothetical protein
VHTSRPDFAAVCERNRVAVYDNVLPMSGRSLNPSVCVDERTASTGFDPKNSLLVNKPLS